MNVGKCKEKLDVAVSLNEATADIDPLYKIMVQ